MRPGQTAGPLQAGTCVPHRCASLAHSRDITRPRRLDSKSQLQAGLAAREKRRCASLERAPHTGKACVERLLRQGIGRLRKAVLHIAVLSSRKPAQSSAKGSSSSPASSFLWFPRVIGRLSVRCSVLGRGPVSSSCGHHVVAKAWCTVYPEVFAHV